MIFMLQPEAVETHTIDPNVAVQLFSPLAASQRFMVAQLNNPYSSVRCENGFLFVFKQVLNMPTAITLPYFIHCKIFLVLCNQKYNSL